MAAHKFKIGQSVFMRQARQSAQPTSMRYKIVKLVPPQEDGQNQYRIKGSAEAFERIAKESDLSL